MSRSKYQLSLKKRIFILFFAILLLMICAFTFVISRFITRFVEKQLNAEYTAILSDTADGVKNIMWNLTLTSQQILDSAQIPEQIEHYRQTTDLYQKKESYYEILNTISHLTMSNSDVALISLYDALNEEYIFTTLPVTNPVSATPVLYENANFIYRGPGISQSNFVGNPVLSLTRYAAGYGGTDLVLTVESGYYSLDTPFNMITRRSAHVLFLDSNGQVVYQDFPENWNAAVILRDLQSGSQNRYRFFSSTGSQGWSVHLVVANDVYVGDFQLAIRDFVICIVIIAIVVGLIAIYFWRSIYHPLQLFDRQLNLLLANDIPNPPLHSSIPEYDHLLQKVTLLQQEIKQMIAQRIEQEKRHSKMQLEKLRAQINPHFLMNTLNTLHWLALMNDEPEIDRITQSLSHLLSYNLDKEDYATNMERELAALKEYVNLQSVRYTFNFNVHITPENSTLNYPCPKFILQPLVENSLSHGYRDGMNIDLFLRIDDEGIEVMLKDTGTGIDEETVKKLQSPEYTAGQKPQFGIGLQYVVRVLNDFFHGQSYFSITSIPGRETVITLNFPKLKGGGYDA